jgi:hypothetical protein
MRPLCLTRLPLSPCAQAYSVEVVTKKRAWTISRRYNDFVALQELVRSRTQRED